MIAMLCAVGLLILMLGIPSFFLGLASFLWFISVFVCFAAFLANDSAGFWSVVLWGVPCLWTACIVYGRIKSMT